MGSIFCLLVCFALLASPPQAVANSVQDAGKPTIVTVQTCHGLITITVDSKLIRDTQTENLLYVFNQVYTRYGVEHPLLVYLEQDVPFIEIWNVKDVAAKAQLNNLRFFVVYRPTNSATEIKWGESTPFPPK
jgi:hypothetical protein